jgi:hypothetical protein
MKGLKKFKNKGFRKVLRGRKTMNGKRPGGARRRVVSKFGRGARSNATKVLAQGVGAVSAVPFGSRVGSDLRCWDAKLPMHLPLPRAVGPYLVVRTTRRIMASAECVIFGTFQNLQKPSGASYGVQSWSTVCGVHDHDASVAISAASNALQFTMPMTGLGSACTLVPAALSVQIMNPGAIGTASGIVYAGVMPTQADVADRTETWRSYFDKFVEFQSPRLMSAGKLALKGVQINSYPLSMNALSDFTTVKQDVDEQFTWLSTSHNHLEPKGMAPIMVYNTFGTAGLALEYLVTTEWRVRFDLDSPASSAHVHHPVSSDQAWSRLMARATSMGNGVIDIADTIADVGQSIGRARAAFS